MTELAKWAWIIFFIVLFAGFWGFVIIAAEVVVFLLMWWLKPEWLKSFSSVCIVSKINGTGL